MRRRPSTSIVLNPGCFPVAKASTATDRTRAQLEEHVRDEHSTFTWLLTPIFERCGFAIEDAVYSGDGIFAKYVLRAA